MQRNCWQTIGRFLAIASFLWAFAGPLAPCGPLVAAQSPAAQSRAAQSPAAQSPAAQSPAAGAGREDPGERAATGESQAARRGAKPVPVDAEYLELLQLFADTIDQVERNYVKPISRRELLEAAIRGMLEELDQYSDYIPPEDLDQFRRGVDNEFGGIGITVNLRDERLTVISPILGGPAYRGGVLAGDIITHIDGQSLDGITLDGAVKRIKGKLGTKVTLTVIHAASPEQPQEVVLTRETVKVRTVLGDRRKKDGNWQFLYDPQRRIGYVRIVSFGKRTVEELKQALSELKEQEATALVLDLRSNPGGLLNAAIEVCDLFVASGRIVSTAGRNQREQVWNAHSENTYTDLPLAVLVNRFSASASEIVAACLQDHQRAVIIGERTWGKGSVQNVISLESGKSALKLTTAGYFRPSGKNIHRQPDAGEEDSWGVLPSRGYEVKLSAVQMSQWMLGRQQRDVLAPGEEPLPLVDPQLVKALAYLQTKLDSARADGSTASVKPE